MRHSRPQYFFLALACMMWCSCARHESVRLDLDFSKRQNQCCSLAVQVVGGSAIDTGFAFRNEATALVCMTPSEREPKQLVVSFSDLAVRSNRLDSAQIDSLRQRLTNEPVAFAWKDGELTPCDSARLVQLAMRQWDLYRVLLRMIPVLPSGPIAAGARWERERLVPLVTGFGHALGHLYQSCRLDSVSHVRGGGRMAHVAWDFTYRIEAVDSSVTSVLRGVPTAGKGVGWAVIDLERKGLARADVSFRAPGDTSMAAVWQEHVSVRSAN